MPLRQAHEIGALVGLALFNHEVTRLGVQATDQRGSEGPRYSETRQVEILDKLIARMTAVRDQINEENEI